MRVAKDSYAGGETITLHYSLINPTSGNIAVLMPVYNIYQNARCNTLQLNWTDSLGRKIEKNVFEGYEVNPPYSAPGVESRLIKPGDSITGVIRLPFGQEGKTGQIGGWKHEYFIRSGNYSEKFDTLPAGSYTMTLNYTVLRSFPCADNSPHWIGSVHSDTTTFHVR